MVTKGKLKMALAADKGTDFKQLNKKKKEKEARKKKAHKGGGKPKSNGEIVEEEWEDMEQEGKESASGEDEQDSGSDAEEGEDAVPLKIDFDGIDESDSDSSASGIEHDNDFEADEDEEDIPVSDLEDLDDEDKEDIVPHQRLTINNTVALTAALKRIALPISKLPFSEHQSVTTSAAVQVTDVSDDINRELAFYNQSLSAAQEARKLLKAEDVPFTRPTDYFAEMVKADEHMAKIKAKLIDAAASKKAAAEARKQRDLKKFGKQVQVEKQQERDKERKQTLEKIKVLKRKRQGADNEATNEADLFDVALEDETSKPSRRDRQGPNKRQKKDEKFGFGGKKRFKKSNDAMSSSDLKGFSSKKMKGGAKSRPGKARRAAKR